MSLRYLGGYVSPSYNPLAANVGPGVNVAQTQGVYTTQAALESLSAGQWCTDPDFNETTLLLQADGAANASQNNTFLDSSTNNLTLTRNGTQTQGSFSPFSAQPGYWSGYFGGTGYYATTPFQSLPTTTSTFTIEAWIFQTAYPVAQGGPVQPSLVGDQNPTGAGANWMFGVLSTGLLSFWWNDTGVKACVGNTVTPLNTWVHVAVSVSANAIKLFVNGQLQTLTGNTTLGNRGSDQGRTTIGQYAGTNSYIYGYVSNLRIVTGTALYSTSFTPSTTPLTAISGTTFLTLQNNTTFKDASTNNRTITPTLASGQPFSPVAPQYAYSPAVTGGSTYKIRTDYLTAPSSANLITFTGDFTLEAWVYSTVTTTGDWGLMDARTSGGSAQNWVWNITGYSSGFLMNFYTASTNRNGATRIPANSWNHLAVVRTGTTLKYYINGVVDPNTFTISGTINGASSNTVFLTNNKDYAASAEFGSQGYIADLRTVNGTAVYTANFTPPTAPLTVITNTSLLLKNTNAGIADNSLKTVAETVGNAQVSTSVKKYGSGSMAFDGTGDWLLLPDSPALQMGLGDFTVEGWVYLTATGTARGLVSKGTGTTGWSVNITSTNFLQATFSATSITGTIPLVANTWYHFAMVRFSSSVGNIKIYLNGALAASSATAITTDFIQTNPLYVGANRTAADPMLGYMDDVRITKMARYKDSFIPPTIAFARQ